HISNADTSSLSLHDALPISNAHYLMRFTVDRNFEFRKQILEDLSDVSPRLKITEYVREGKFSSVDSILSAYGSPVQDWLNKNKRSEEHTSELQSRVDLVCRL